MDAPPEGTIALLFTDIEGSTALVSRLGDRWHEVLADHHAILGGAIAAEGGYVDGTEGDAFFATFADAQGGACRRRGAARARRPPLARAASRADGAACGFRRASGDAGDVDGAAVRYAEADRIGAPFDTTILWRRETFHGDLAMGQGRFADALAHYAASVEVAQAIGNDVQLLLDLQSIAWMLAKLGRDAGALEAAGMADSQMADIAGSFAASGVPLHDDIAAAAARLGEAAAAELRERGRAAPAASRVTRAVALALQRTA